ncbi:Oidioi.mRNA.OKI2018_I69.chr1.g601.t1.cds [Oikopleura dioica]|uniref:Oidioi.mRNA.OKI2018_I69.chr1.g601.t1.cds n=1 Tax=Oikopleura dioica TaxID=34765 RepID=A0ABN7SKD4_OIKDI|nr:Oidioi.mRNA.OKI2018_I69.chr1.g601.t1.cds [Oikopleura dioica]
MAIHDVQNSRYQARQRRDAGRHQAEINKLGSKWTRVQAVKHAVTLSRPSSGRKKEPVIDSTFAETYRRDVRNFMQKFHGRKNTHEARTSIELTKVLLQQDAKNEKMGQLLNGLYDLESDDDLEEENYSPVTSKSSMDSDEYNMRRQFTQSAYTRKSSATKSSIKRSKSFIGSQLSENQSDYFQKIKAVEKDFYFEEPKQPPILFFTDGRGNFITGKEQQFIRARNGL